MPISTEEIAISSEEIPFSTEEMPISSEEIISIFGYFRHVLVSIFAQKITLILPQKSFLRKYSEEKHFITL
jgi:hypothetical protein